MPNVEKKRKRECWAAGCPKLGFCETYWGKECKRLGGERIPRFRALIRYTADIENEEAGMLLKEA